MDVIKIVLICIVCALFSKVISKTNQETGLLVSICTLIVIGAYVIDIFTDIKSRITSLLDITDIDYIYLTSIFKALGICYVCELGASSCRDAGESALAGIIDISGRIAIVMICFPILEKLFEVIKNIMGI